MFFHLIVGLHVLRSERVLLRFFLIFEGTWFVGQNEQSAQGDLMR